MNEQISAWPISANAASIIQNLKPILINQEFTRMSTNMEQFSYVSKLMALAHLYVELSLPLPAALRAAEADLPVVGSFGYLDGRSTTIDGAECAFPRPIRSGRLD